MPGFGRHSNRRLSIRATLFARLCWAPRLPAAALFAPLSCAKRPHPSEFLAAIQIRARPRSARSRSIRTCNGCSIAPRNVFKSSRARPQRFITWTLSHALHGTTRYWNIDSITVPSSRQDLKSPRLIPSRCSIGVDARPLQKNSIAPSPILR